MALKVRTIKMVIEDNKIVYTEDDKDITFSNLIIHVENERIYSCDYKLITPFSIAHSKNNKLFRGVIERAMKSFIEIYDKRDSDLDNNKKVTDITFANLSNLIGSLLAKLQLAEGVEYIDFTEFVNYPKFRECYDILIERY